MIPDFKKLDDIDVLICGRPTPESDRAMTEYIKAHKPKQPAVEKTRLITPSQKKLTAKANR